MSKCAYTSNEKLLIISNFIGGTDYTLSILEYTSKWGQHYTLQALSYIDSIGIDKFIESLELSKNESPKTKTNIVYNQVSLFDNINLDV